jgi:fructoselysine-6-P-deglycase FrlB-like protein
VREALAHVRPVGLRDVVALVGIGASEHICRGAAVAWRRAGLRAVALSASEVLDGGAGLADVHVGLSESGRSAETVGAFGSIAGRKVGITNGPGSPLTEVVDELVLLDSGPDSPVYTTGYSATMQAVGMLGEHWQGRTGDWSALPEQVAAVLAAGDGAAEAVSAAFEAAQLIDVVGSGTSTASAGEGALLLREAARAHASAQETYTYLHGPMEPLDARTACIVTGDGREVQLAEDVSGLGCPTLLVTARDVPSRENLTVVRLPGTTSPLARAVLEILPVQALAWRLASARGLRADGFRYQQQDTKLDDAG